ncbi:hypothetical protein EYD45_09000 [Hyunsoonleella flava]|uniref:Lipoprotein n=1 Tax=Hyunsoonleella flava TaxID=2527939 RepID=A0A4Q9FFX3_9FLAO|nr:hypothetical protein [Hyunsoonleella flava]TBN03645.1 hypothetical protein EYD45_09000 [Hyunsoonleella flava]
MRTCNQHIAKSILDVFNKTLVLFICVISSTSCKEKTQSQIDKETLPGDYFELKEDNIKLFLPVYFQEFSEETYGELIDALPDSNEKQIEKKRFNYLKFSKGSTYYFKDIASSTLITVKMHKYMPFSKNESSFLLGFLSNQCADYAFALGSECKKLQGRYSGNAKTKVFKAVYELSKEDNYTYYNTMYIISSNSKTLSMNIYSNTLENYNQFIEKTVIR